MPTGEEVTFRPPQSRGGPLKAFRRFPFNVDAKSADDPAMSDVEAIRYMATERDLEFVDLDTYGVDPAAGAILPADLSRHHHVVAVKRKFGTPVIATADPDDLFAQDSIRALLGRDFISVVAAPEQIDHYIDLMFGDGTGWPAGVGTNGSSPEGNPTADALDQALAEASMDAEGPPPLLLPTLDIPPPLSVPGETTELPAPPPPLPPLDLGEEDQLAALARSFEGDAVTAGDVGAVGTTSDDGTDAADMVAEAVATYHELHPEASAGSTDAATASFPPLAKALVDGGRVSLEDMSAALEECRVTGQSITRILTNQKLVTEADLMWGMAEEMGLKFVDLDTAGVDLTVAGALPESTARHHNVIVIANENGVPVVATSNPTDVFAMDDLRTIIGTNFIVVVATRTQISSYIGRAFNSGNDAADMAMEASLGIEVNSKEEVSTTSRQITETAPIVRYVNLLVLQALNERASDIHVEPTEHDLRIRYRIDGVLHDVSTAPRTILPPSPLVSRSWPT